MIWDLLGAREEPPGGPVTQPGPVTEGAGAAGSVPVVRLRGAGRVYPGPPPVRALWPSDLEVMAGELVTVTGRSGSGKSTFLNLVGLLDAPTEGTYELSGIDTGRLPERDRTALRGREIGFVFQSFHLIPHYSAVANVALALTYTRKGRRKRFDRAAQVLEQVGLGHLAATPVGRLSGGERQRVAIARAVAGGPSLLLCDEPTGNLDSVSAEAVLEMIAGLNAQGVTVLLATHDLAVAALGRRNVVLADGRMSTREGGGASVPGQAGRRTPAQPNGVDAR